MRTENSWIYFAYILPYSLLIFLNSCTVSILKGFTAITYNSFYPMNGHLDLIQVNTDWMLTISPGVSVSLAVLVVWCLFSRTFLTKGSQVPESLQVGKSVCSLYTWKSVWLDIKILGWYFWSLSILNMLLFSSDTEQLLKSLMIFWVSFLCKWLHLFCLDAQKTFLSFKIQEVYWSVSVMVTLGHFLKYSVCHL